MIAGLIALLAVVSQTDSGPFGDAHPGGSVQGTAVGNLNMSTYAISFGTDPADAGDLRLSNNESIAWEASPTGTDLTLKVNASGILTSSADFSSGGGLTANGACATMASGAICCYDDLGAQCGFPLTNATPSIYRIYGYSASPIGSGGNLVGGDLRLSGGEGSSTLVCTQANCGAADTVSVTVDGTTSTCTRDASLNDSTHFTCGASDAAMATNVAACLNQATGVASCAGAGCTLFTGVAGTAYVYRSSTEPGGGRFSVASSGNHAVAANGTDGNVVVQTNLTVPLTSTIGFAAGTSLIGASDGASSLTNNAGTSSATLTASWLTAAKTSGYPLIGTDDQTVFTNTGAVAQVIFTLPAAAASKGPYTFVVDAVQNIRVTAGSGDVIDLAGTDTAAAGHVDCASKGCTLTLVGIAVNKWFAIMLMGTWTTT